MKHSRRLISLLLLLAVTAGSVSALEAPDTQNVAVSDAAVTVQNPNPKILSIEVPYTDGVEENDIIVHTNFTISLSESATSNEVPQIYRAVNKGNFKAIPYSSSKNRFYSWDIDKEHNRKTLQFMDLSCKNGSYYRYKLATATVDPSTDKQTPIAYSNVKSHYYLKRMTLTYLHISNLSQTRMKVSWKKQCNSKADGYQLRYYHYNRHGHSTVSEEMTRTVKGGNTSSYTFKNRSPNQQYLVQIRSYKKYKGKTYYSHWSDHARRYQ